jgi:hypothetical protein
MIIKLVNQGIDKMKIFQIIFFIIFTIFTEQLIYPNQVDRALDLARTVFQNSPVFTEQLVYPNQVDRALDLARIVFQNSSVHNVQSHEKLRTQLSQQQNQVKIQSVPALHQGHFRWDYAGAITSDLSWQDVKDSEGGNCGYHAFRNVFSLVQDPGIIRNQISPQAAELLQSAQDYQLMMELWAPAINRSRQLANPLRTSKNISWLGGGELELLIREFVPAGIPIIVIEHVRQQGFELDEQRLRAIQNFVALDRAKLGFIWNSGLRTDPSKMGGTHWVGFVAVKNGKNITLYDLNSIPGANPDFNIITKFFASTPEEIQRMIDEKNIGSMQNDLERQERNLRIFNEGPRNDQIYNEYVGCNNNQGNWINTRTQKQIAYHSGLDCKTMDMRYPGSWFVDFGEKDRFIFKPDEMLHSIFNVCVNGWRDYQNWPVEIQIKMTDLLLQYLAIAENNPNQFIEFYKYFDFNDLENILRKLPATFQRHGEIQTQKARILNNLAKR